MKILVIGSKGFIGSTMYAIFKVDPNNIVIGCDILNDYTDGDYYQVDFSNPDYHAVFQKFQFDCCINCSGSSSVPRSFENPLHDYLLNTVNVARILEAIRLYNPKCSFINLSSAAVYGNPGQLPVSEKAAVNPISPYGANKLAAERICEMYTSHYGLSTVNIRIFSAYGVGLKKQIVWDVCQKLLKHEPLLFFGTGNETRDFIEVTDIVLAIETIMKNKLTGVVNVANGIEVSVRQLIEHCCYLFGAKPEIHFNGEIRVGDPVNWRADIALLSECGYCQGISFEVGLDKYIKWVKELK